MNFPSMLIDSGYTLADKTSIFIKRGYAGIAYSDGDATENRIADIIDKAQDLSIFSRELAIQCSDWPSLYHLSGSRANILRPFHSTLKQANVLEIGAGCGAITRYLGESGANVLALEGSPRRAVIARSRTRELDNVTVVADKFDRFQCDCRFDIITLIGVLEYAALFTDGEDPVVDMLTRVRELLKPEGRLILAIENQLGLKYFAGAAEDHTGEPMLGIEGRYSEKGPQTFGRKVLTTKLQQAGFINQQFMAPFPDYKLPISILTEQGLNCDTFDAAAFCWQNARRDPQLPSYLVFAPELTWPLIEANGLTLDLANSFLVIGQMSAEVEHDTSILAYHYSTNGRHAAFCKETLFVQSENDSIKLHYHPLSSDALRSREGRYIQFNVLPTAKYIHGKSLALQFLRIVTQDDWNIKEIGKLLRKYLGIVEAYLAEKGQTANFNSVNSILPGILFDVIPQNIICLSDGTYRIIDQEWVLKNSISLGFLLFRSLLQTTYSITRFGKNITAFPKTQLDFYISSFDSIGIKITEEEINYYNTLENNIQNDIYFFNSESIYIDKPNIKEQKINNSLHDIINKKENIIRELNKKNNELNIKNNRNDAALDLVRLRIMSQQIQREIKGTVSWITSPLQVKTSLQHVSTKKTKVKILLDRISRKNRNQLSALYQALQKNPLFDADFYMRDDAQLCKSKVELITHYFFYGASEGRNPNSYFFTSWYLAEYPDVASSGINPLLHFLTQGVQEGRNPNPYFLTTWYLDKYPDVKKQGIHPLLHYIQHGHQARTWPNPYFDPEWYAQTYLKTECDLEPLAHFLSQNPLTPHNPNPYFDSQWYLRTYPWVAKMGMHPLQHFIYFGDQEKTNPSPYFDSQWYIEHYPESTQNKLSPFAHYLSKLKDAYVNPNPYFNSDWYRTTYPDIVKSGVDPLLHYIVHGADENRDPGPYFSTYWYLKKYSDVKKSGINPLHHFLEFGAFECRDPHPNFDTEWYLNKYPEVLTTNLPPALHFIQTGKKEGNLPHDPNRFKDKFDLDEVFSSNLTGDDNDKYASFPDELTNKNEYIVDKIFLNNHVQCNKLEEFIEKIVDSIDNIHVNTLIFPNSEFPLVSIIIPVFNEPEFTLRCIKSIYKVNLDIPYEIIIVDDCSSELNYEEYFSSIDTIKIARKNINSGFIESCNYGASISKGYYLCFLNNDTIVLDGWMEHLIDTFTDFPDTGIVGSKLIYPDGSLQEAGCIIWNDGSAWNIGRNTDDILEPSYSYARDVDYCSGASIIMTKELFVNLNGFDEYYRPAYYEDTDISLKAREIGCRVIFQPLSVVIHYEGITSGTDITSGVKSYQIENRSKFINKWKHYLKYYQTCNGKEPERIDRRSRYRALILDCTTPTPDQDSGSVDIYNIMLLLREMDFETTFIPVDNFLYMKTYTANLQRIGVKCLFKPYIQKIDTYLKNSGHLFDLVLLVRPTVAHRHIESVRKYCFNAKIIFHTVDLHFLRMQREYELRKNPSLKIDMITMKKNELGSMIKSDVTTVISDYEFKLIKEYLPKENIKFFPYARHINGTEIDFYNRKDFVFVGGFQHTPNIDAVHFLIANILPHVIKQLPDVKIHIVGSKTPKEIFELSNEQIIVHGYIEDLTSFYEKIRVSLAPLRYGAGIKGKIGSAMAMGVPTVATSLAAEGMNVTDGINVLIADDPIDFAQAMVQIYNDSVLWDKISRNSIDFSNASWGKSISYKRLQNILIELGFKVDCNLYPISLYN